MKVRGMHCEGCVNNVTRALNSVKGVKRIDINLQRERAIVWVKESQLKQQAIFENIRKAVRKAGYLVGDIHSV